MNIKYFYEFTGLHNANEYRVEILEDAVVTAQKINSIDGFSVDYPEIEDKFQSVRGSGCSFNLLSETDRQFIGLYVADMQQYQIRLYENSNLI